MNSPGSNEKNTNILDMKAGIPGIFNSQPWWKASDLYHTIFSKICSKTTKILSKFYYQLMHKRIALKGVLKIYIKTAPTCFGVITIIRECTIWAF